MTDLLVEALRDRHGTVRSLQYRTPDQTLVGTVVLVAGGKAHAYGFGPGCGETGRPLSRSLFKDREAAETAVRAHAATLRG